MDENVTQSLKQRERVAKERVGRKNSAHHIIHPLHEQKRRISPSLLEDARNATRGDATAAAAAAAIHSFVSLHCVSSPSPNARKNGFSFVAESELSAQRYAKKVDQQFQIAATFLGQQRNKQPLGGRMYYQNRRIMIERERLSILFFLFFACPSANNCKLSPKLYSWALKSGFWRVEYNSGRIRAPSQQPIPIPISLLLLPPYKVL